jgi:hypothetical protein
MDLVTFLQTTQDGDRVLDRRLGDQYLLQPSFECRVFLDVLAILVEGRGADAMQLASGQGGLEHVACIHGSFGLAGTDHGVNLVDEEDDLSFLLRQIIEHGFETLLEFAAKLGPRDQRPHVERQEPFTLEALRHLLVDDSLGQPFHDGGFPNTGFADQDGVVLGPPLQHLDRPPNLVVASDDRIELALLGSLRQIDGVSLERLSLILGVRVVDLLAPSNLVHCLLQGRPRRPGLAQDRAQGVLVIDGGQQEQFARDELVVPLLCQLVGDVEKSIEVLRDVDFSRRALDPRQSIDRLHHLQSQLIDVDTGLRQQRACGPPFLVQKRHHHVHRLDVLVVPAHRDALSVGQRHLELRGQLVHAHDRSSLSLQSPSRLAYAPLLRRRTSGPTARAGAGSSLRAVGPPRDLACTSRGLECSGCRSGRPPGVPPRC